MEKYLSFEVNNIIFFDSLQFLNCGLDVLVKNLSKEGDSKFNHLHRIFPNDYKLLLRKGVFPYEYKTSVCRMTERTLPPKSCFYSKLTDEDITQDGYEYAQKLWQAFDMQTMQDYHDLYLQTDVVLLADVFEYFRAMSLDFYKLDPRHHYRSPGLSFDACLRMTNVELELITDPDIYRL
jgi:hypothetical protein